MKIDLQFADLLQGARDDEILSDAPTDTEESSDVAHPLDKIIAEATLGTFLGPGDAGRRHAHNIGVEAQERDAQLTAHYKKLAADAEKQSGTPLAKRAATAETFCVGTGERLAKGEIESRMLRVLSRIRPFCVGDEAELIEKSVKCLDFITFGELAEPVLDRMKTAMEAI